MPVNGMPAKDMLAKHLVDKGLTGKDGLPGRRQTGKGIWPRGSGKGMQGPDRRSSGGFPYRHRPQDGCRAARALTAPQGRT